MITLQAGQYYDIRMEYYENGGGAVARLAWSSPSRPRESIPATRLFQESPTLAVSGFLNVALPSATDQKKSKTGARIHDQVFAPPV